MLVAFNGVVENMNVLPPFDVQRPESNPLDETLKSDTSPIVAPDASDTEIVHTMLVPTRAGLVFEHII